MKPFTLVQTFYITLAVILKTYTLPSFRVLTIQQLRFSMQSHTAKNVRNNTTHLYSRLLVVARDPLRLQIAPRANPA